MIWWHKMLGHDIEWRSVTIPGWDFYAKGRLYKCSCGKMWAK